ncbi:MAG TPA: hypothetical protein VGC99_23605, partial [Candidatus Tectomicrobia bacterium]
RPSAVHWPAQHGEVAEEGADRSGDDVRAVFEAILPPQEIDRLCADYEVIARQRRLNRGRLVRAWSSPPGPRVVPTRPTA